MAGFSAKFHESWQGVVVLKTATADKLMIRNEDISKLSALKQEASHVVPFWEN